MQAITKDKDVVVKALKTSKMLEVDKDESMVRRITPLPESDDLDVRSVYVVSF